MDQAEAVEKVQKLLSLSAGTNNPAEAALAAARAQEIMDRHRIESSMLVEDDDADDEDIRDFSSVAEGHLDPDIGAGITTWLSYLAQAVAKQNACRIFHQHSRGRRTTEIVGRPSDVATVRYLYAYLRRECERLVNRDGAGMGRTWRNNFLIGCVTTIKAKLAAHKETVVQQIRSESLALIKVDAALARIETRAIQVDEFLKQKHPEMNKGRAPSFRGQATAFQAGAQAAREISVGGGGRKLTSGAKALGSGA